VLEEEGARPTVGPPTLLPTTGPGVRGVGKAALNCQAEDRSRASFMSGLWSKPPSVPG